MADKAQSMWSETQGTGFEPQNSFKIDYFLSLGAELLYLEAYNWTFT